MDFLLELNWFAVGQIVLIDLLLGGDNAIVIALACRNLPPRLRMQGILWGTLGAIGIRIALITFAVTLLQIPYLKLTGGVLLFWIGVKLLALDGGEHDNVHASDRLLIAIRTIIVADLVMSIDNVVAVASAAEQLGGKHQLALVTFGIAISIPIIVWGSRLVMLLMDRYKIIVIGGAALLGYLAGSIAFSDMAWSDGLKPDWGTLDITLMSTQISLPGLLAAAGVVGLGHWRARRGNRKSGC